ncbi:helix-turn-helix domain-containing protein [Barnesiella intestinihominis]|uniref:helix-turn-helix domain-containing protein n=1 Tax=Barnesiella intestinihominis TaxID=487174 RepID=UPI003966DEDF
MYYSLRQEWIPQAQDMESEETGVSRNFVSQMGGKLEEYIREKELYLNPRLSLSDLAVEMGTNRSYLSNCLNNELGITFYDYINSFRLEKAKEILDDSGFEGCIEDVAIRSGFNSVSTFRRSFQKKYGCTPSQYRKNALGHR